MLSLWRSQRQGSGGYYLCVHLLVFVHMAFTCMAWLKWLPWLFAVFFLEASWVSGTWKSCSKMNNRRICGLKFVTLGTVKFLSGSLLTAFVSLLWEWGWRQTNMSYLVFLELHLHLQQECLSIHENIQRQPINPGIVMRILNCSQSEQEAVKE